MHFKTIYHSILLFERLFCRYVKMPFYAVIFRTSKTGAIADNWDKARGMRDASTNSYAKKFFTKLEAEKYITDFGFKIADKVESNNKNIDGLEVKKKRLDKAIQLKSTSLKDHIQKIQMAFNNLQAAVVDFSELTTTHVEEIKKINDLVYCKLHEILNVNLSEAEEDACLVLGEKRTRSLHESELFPRRRDPLSASFNCSDFTKLSQHASEIAKKQFIMNEKNEVVVYTDGACTNNGYYGAKAGAGVWFGYDNPLNLALKVPGSQTNNNAEIFSSIRAIEQVKAAGLSKVNIHTDSNFLIQSITDWMPRWKTNGWKTKSGKPVKNKEMFEKLDLCIQSMESVSWTHVRGHVGIPGNEAADKLARIGTIK